MNKLEKTKTIVYIIFILCGSLFLLVSTIVELPIACRKLDRYYHNHSSHIKEEVVEEEIIEEPVEEVSVMDALNEIEDRKEWYHKYKEIAQEHPELCTSESIYDKYTDDEIYMMQRVIETECYGCSFEAKTHVASVIINRIEGDNGFPDDPITVCTSPGQFVYGRKQISEDTVLALEYAYEIEDTTCGALYFNCMTPRESWNGRELIFTDEVGHSFY